MLGSDGGSKVATMRSLIAALVIAGLLIASGVAVSVIASLPEEPAAPAAAPDERARKGSHDHASHGGGAHPWVGGKGAIPTLTDALLSLDRRGSIVITDDAGFNPANGVRSGTGTYDDPFVISGWFVDSVLIADTSMAFEFKENYVSDILILDWTGKGGYVHHNFLQNMRTNRNVERTGDPSATVIENNLILEVEQLRHFDGEVRNNVIGQKDKLPLLRGDGVVFDIAGLNGAGIHDNVIYGGVDMKIHGHHHTDTPGVSSHNHGKPDEVQEEPHYEDHQVRYVDFLFYRNKIVDDKFGMRYNDLDHAGDDRQATSEQEPALERPHIHYTHVVLRDNLIEGATLTVAVLNAPDQLHNVSGERAVIEVAGNRIVKPRIGNGIVLHDVRNATVLIHDNIVEKPDLPLSRAAAIMLARFWNSTVILEKNQMGAWEYGIRASEFDASTTWAVVGNRAAGSAHPVYWDDTVANPPGGAEEHEHEHEHGDEDPTSAVRRFSSL